MEEKYFLTSFLGLLWATFSTVGKQNTSEHFFLPFFLRSFRPFFNPTRSRSATTVDEGNSYRYFSILSIKISLESFFIIFFFHFCSIASVILQVSFSIFDPNTKSHIYIFIITCKSVSESVKNRYRHENQSKSNKNVFIYSISCTKDPISLQKFDF